MWQAVADTRSRSTPTAGRTEKVRLVTEPARERVSGSDDEAARMSDGRRQRTGRRVRGHVLGRSMSGDGLSGRA